MEIKDWDGQVALKEWAVIVVAMRRGLHNILLRKGGLADKKQTFQMEQPRFFLFPTYEHQSEKMIVPEQRNILTDLLKSPHSPEKIILDTWAEVQECFTVTEASQLKALPDPHIWSEEYFQMRLAYKPEKPLYVIRLKIYSLPSPKTLTVTPQHAGCRSWVHL